MKNETAEIVIFKSSDGEIQLDIQLEKETIWLDTHQIGELFGRDRTVVLRHLRNIYHTGELDREATCAKIAQVAADGKTRKMDIYNLDAIISVGYRVNSKRGTEFRIWATNVVSTQKEAIGIAQDIARNQQSDTKVHGTDGRIRAGNSYGNDSFPPRDRK